MQKETVNAWISLDSEQTGNRREIMRMHWKKELTGGQIARLKQVMEAAEKLIHKEMDILGAEIA